MSEIGRFMAFFGSFSLLFVGVAIRTSSKVHDSNAINDLLKEALLKKIRENNDNNGIQDTNDKNVTSGLLQRQWANNPPLSPWAKHIYSVQHNCSLPMATFELDNDFGFGSHISLWSQGVCNGWEMDTPSRIRTNNPQWLWMDQTVCDTNQAIYSPFLCYFPEAEMQCPNDLEQDLSPLSRLPIIPDPRAKKRTMCKLLKGSNQSLLEEFRASSTEFLFSKLSEVVIDEAERQASLVFPDGIPKDLITVHIRWGDKFWEMDLAKVEEYVEAVSTILHRRRNGGDNSTANIYLATEDPIAVEHFSNATPPGWKIYTDRTVEELDKFRPKRGNRASHTSKNTKGRAGLVGLGSLLLAMEAQDFVLTTKSNWSRLMNQLRTNIINPRCGNCTSAIDLRPGNW